MLHACARKFDVTGTVQNFLGASVLLVETILSSLQTDTRAEPLVAELSSNMNSFSFFFRACTSGEKICPVGFQAIEFQMSQARWAARSTTLARPRHDPSGHRLARHDKVLVRGPPLWPIVPARNTAQ